MTLDQWTRENFYSYWKKASNIVRKIYYKMLQNKRSHLMTRSFASRFVAVFGAVAVVVVVVFE